MQKRAELTIKGKVQKAGFRDFVEETAYEFGIKGTVENAPDGTVKVACEAPDAEIKKFVAALRIRQYPIIVEDITAVYSDAKHEFNDFRILCGKPEAEVAERADEAARYMRKLYSEMREFPRRNERQLRRHGQEVRRHTRGNARLQDGRG